MTYASAAIALPRARSFIRHKEAMLGWLVLAAVAAAARPKQTTKPDTLFKGPGVTILDRQGVQAIRSNKESWIVAFYAPWCDLGVPSCGGAFTSFKRLVSISR